MTRKRLKPIAILILLTGIVTWLLLSTAEDDMVYYRTLEEVLSEPDRFQDRAFRLTGQLVENSIRVTPDNRGFTFTMEDPPHRIDVIYSGIRPDTLLPGQNLLIEGRLLPKTHQFNASRILTQCPSRYIADSEAVDAGRRIPSTVSQ